MKRGPKPKWCYVCQKNPPCSYGSPCQRLTGKEKAQAYAVGYTAKHGDKLRKNAADYYRKNNPNAEPYKPQEIRSSVAEQKESERVRKQREREEGWRLNTLLNGDKRTRWKKTLRVRSGRKQADQEADR